MTLPYAVLIAAILMFVGLILTVRVMNRLRKDVTSSVTSTTTNVTAVVEEFQMRLVAVEKRLVATEGILAKALIYNVDLDSRDADELESIITPQEVSNE